MIWWFCSERSLSPMNLHVRITWISKTIQIFFHFCDGLIWIQFHKILVYLIKQTAIKIVLCNTELVNVKKFKIEKRIQFFFIYLFSKKISACFIALSPFPVRGAVYAPRRDNQMHSIWATFNVEWKNQYNRIFQVCLCTIIWYKFKPRLMIIHFLPRYGG